MIYLETGSTNPYYNLAFEEVVLTRRREDDYLILWQNDNTIVIGQNQNTDAEINHDAVDKYHVNVVRRSTGGGAVYHDLGNLNYSFITDEDNSNKIAFDKFTQPVVSALKVLGLNAQASGRNDILIETNEGEWKKVSGVAQRHVNGRVLHHGTLLYNENLERANEVLRVDPEKIKSKGVQSVRSRIANISEFMTDKNVSIEEFKNRIKKELAGSDCKEGSLTGEELKEAEKLYKEKYSTWEWNYGKSFEADITNKKRFNGGSIEVCIKLLKGRINNIKFYGDFMSTSQLDVLESALIGCEYNKASVLKVLDTFDLHAFFGSITEDEIIQVLF